MRILIIRNAYRKDTGGAEQYSFNLALALKRAGHKPYLVTNQKAIIERCQKESINFIKSKWHESQEWDKRYYFRYIFYTLWYVFIILKNKVDIVHPQSRDDFVFATNAGWLLKKKLIWTDHADLKYIMDRVNHKHPRMQSWILSAANKCSKIICVSSSEKEKIVDVAPELKNKLTVIHNGVFLPNSTPVNKNGFVIGANSRLVEDKGIKELIEGFANTRKIPFNSELWIVGGYSGNLDYFNKIAKSFNVGSKVKFIGYVKNPFDYISSFDIFIHPSYHEAFSLAIVEACMLSKPVIVTKVGGATEMLNSESAIFIEPKNSKQISKAIDFLYENKDVMHKIAKNAGKIAREDYDFQKIVEKKVIKLYKS